MKKFIKNNSGFVCEHCGLEVPPHNSTSRDHCNHCLYGLHVDVNPGDRLNDCKGLLVPIGLKTAGGKTQIAYDCSKCGERVYCIISEDDNNEAVFELMTKIWK